MIGTQTERPDGTKSCAVVTDAGEQDAACPGGMTDEPVCRVDCARLAVLIELFSCSSGGCGQPPEGMRPDPTAGASADCDDAGRDERDASHVAPVVGGHRKEGSFTPNCTNADRPGGPADYGDPTDPNGGEPPDEGQIPYIVDDGVTDPVNPGEEPETPGGSIRLDMYGALGDPANPPGPDDSDRIPGGGPPSTGDAERDQRP